MADKAATIYIVDVGRTTGDFHQGRDESDLDFALRYVWDKITATIATGRKTDCIGVIAFRTDGTDNELSDDPAYHNVRILSPIQQFLMEDVRSIGASLVPSNTVYGDGLSALVIGIQTMKTFCRHLKYKKNIFVITDGRGEIDFDDTTKSIVEQMIENNINLTVLGVDFDDEEFGFVEDPQEKGNVKRENERGWKELVGQVEGVYGTMKEAVDELEIPRIKAVRAVATFKGKLTLGDPETYESAMSIDIERFPRTMVAKARSASKFVEGPAGEEEGEIKAEAGPSTQLEDRGAKGLQGIKHAYSYKVKDESAPTGEVDVERAQLDKGYKYGRTIVPIAESDKEVVNLATTPGMEIVSFFETKNYKRFFHMSQTSTIVHQKGNYQAAMALSSFIHALYELDCYALVRFVRKDNEAPKMLLLAPSIENDFECLIDVELPFHEDVRPYKFPPLNTVKTTSGKTLDKHRFIPTDAMNAAMSDFVDSMMLTSAPTASTSDSGSDDDDEEDLIPTDAVFSPVLHRITQVIKYRAANPTKPIPPVPSTLLRWSHPPAELLTRASDPLQKLISTCDIKFVEPKTKGRRTLRENTSNPQSGIDIDSLLGITPQTRRSKKISFDNAIPDYKRRMEALLDAVDNGEDLDPEEEFRKTTKEMFEIARELIRTSLSSTNYDRAVGTLGIVRETMEGLEGAKVYNDEFRWLKRDVLGRTLGGDRFDAWVRLKEKGLGLITEGVGSVSEDEARAFWDPNS